MDEYKVGKDVMELQVAVQQLNQRLALLEAKGVK